MNLDPILLSLPDVLLIGTKRYTDSRGYFAETYVRRDFADAGIGQEFVSEADAVLSSKDAALPALHDLPDYFD
jgi:dTDP-4-dehydrorhamnose 3,5-epimerase